MERRAIIILSIVLFIWTSSTLTGVVRLLDYLSLDECGKELYLIVKIDNEVYALQDDLMVDVFISINGKKEYRGLPHVLDMDVYNARGVTDLAYSFLAWSSIFLNSASFI